MIGVCAVAGLLVAAADLITRVATTPPPAAGWVGRVAAMVTSTEWGLLWAARFAALAAIVGVLVRARRHREDLGRTADRRLDVFLGICLVALAVAGAVDGHPSSVASATAWAIAADAVHLLSAALWIGALAALVVVIASPGRRALLRVCRLRFSMLMAATVVALVISGLLEVGRQIDRVPDVLETGYGLLVTAKAVLLLVMLGLALANALALHELGSRRRAGGGIRRGGVLAEATLGVLVLALVAVLVQTAPPRAADGVGGGRTIRRDPDGHLGRPAGRTDRDAELARLQRLPGFVGQHPAPGPGAGRLASWSWAATPAAGRPRRRAVLRHRAAARSRTGDGPGDRPPDGHRRRRRHPVDRPTRVDRSGR